MLADSNRRDTLTCSTACRVRAHRTGAMREFRTAAEDANVPPWLLAQVAAAMRLGSEFSERIRRGKDIDDDDFREDVCNAFDEVLQAALEAAE
ncbi:MAG: hypothetical protein RIE74_02090 [Pseudomonadales bacterium]